MRGLPSLNVSRETEDALREFEKLVIRWNPVINLVSNSTIPNLWTRHIVDSAQIFRSLVPFGGVWVDVGSGGGFPGVVLAIIARDMVPGLRFVFVESDTRKCSFLRTVARDLCLPVVIRNERVELLSVRNIDYLSARAVGNLISLLNLVENIVSRETSCIFLKGQTYKKEVAEARKNWDFKLKVEDSVTSGSGKLLFLREIKRLGDGD